MTHISMLSRSICIASPKTSIEIMVINELYGNVAPIMSHCCLSEDTAARTANGPVGPCDWDGPITTITL